jgi:hypothetical protein
MLRNRSAIVGLAAGLALLVAGCAKTNRIQEPWTDADAATKQKWESPRSPEQLDRLRNRLVTNQSDH